MSLQEFLDWVESNGVEFSSPDKRIEFRERFDRIRVVRPTGKFLFLFAALKIIALISFTFI